MSPKIGIDFSESDHAPNESATASIARRKGRMALQAAERPPALNGRNVGRRSSEKS
jgi:hypothetical protein